ncbi:hypothetical protein D3C85_1199650 [compost metagenome]
MHRPRLAGDDLADLRDHCAATGLYRERHGQGAGSDRLVFEAEVAVLIGTACAQQGYVHRPSRIKQIFLAFELHQLDQIFLSARRILAPLLARVDVTTQANAREITRTAARHFPEPMHGRADWPAIGFDLVLADQAHHLRTFSGLRIQRVDVVARDDALHQAFYRDMIHPADVHRVANADRKEKSQIPGRGTLLETLRQRLQQGIRREPSDNTDTAHRLARLNIGHGLGSRAYFGHYTLLLFL